MPGMTKVAPKRPRIRKKPKAPKLPAPNPQLNTQTRKVLTKHYRAKHGVR